MELNQDELDKTSSYLKKVKYKNVLQNLKLEYQQDEPDSEPYIYLVLIRIKKSQQHRGYGSKVLSEVIKIADKHGVNIILFATNIFGADLKRLYTFYRKHGFVLKDNVLNKFVYKPKNKTKINHSFCNKKLELAY
jgi:GNAT superfamily N-acetyltransferase